MFNGALKQKLFEIIWKHGTPDEFRAVLDQGVNPRWRHDRDTALTASIRAGRFDLVEELLKRKVNVMVRSGWSDYTPLTCAIYEDRPDIVMALIQYKNELVSFPDGGGVYPLYLVAKRGQLDCLRAFLEAGVSTDQVVLNGDSWTAIHVAAAESRLSCVEVLLDAGAALDIRTGSGSTPLLLAVLNRHVKVVELLLKRGADPFVKDDHGREVLSSAKDERLRVMIEAARLRASLHCELEESESFSGMGL